MGILCTKADLIHLSVYTLWYSPLIYLWLCLHSDTYITATCTTYSVATYILYDIEQTLNIFTNVRTDCCLHV